MSMQDDLRTVCEAIEKLELLTKGEPDYKWVAEYHQNRRRSAQTGRLLTYRPEDGYTATLPEVIPADGVYGVLDGNDAWFIESLFNTRHALLDLFQTTESDLAHAVYYGYENKDQTVARVVNIAYKLQRTTGEETNG